MTIGRENGTFNIYRSSARVTVQFKALFIYHMLQVLGIGFDYCKATNAIYRV